MYLFFFLLRPCLLQVLRLPFIWFDSILIVFCLFWCIYPWRCFCVALVIFCSGINWLLCFCFCLPCAFVLCVAFVFMNQKKSSAFCSGFFAVFWSSIAFSSLPVSSGLAFAGLLFPFWIVSIIFYKFWLFQWSFLCGCLP